MAEEVIGRVRPLLEAKELLVCVTEVYARSRRPTVLFLQVAEAAAVMRTATTLRQARVEFEGKTLWANRDRTKEERLRIRPVGKMIAQLRQARDLLPAPLRADKDAEGGWRQRAEEVLLTTNKCKTSVVVGNMVNGECREVSDAQLQSAIGCELFARLGEVRAAEDGN